MPYCKACHAEIEFLKATTTGQRVPVNAEPVWITKDQHGNGYFLKTGQIIIGRIIGDADDFSPAVEAYVSHFATCPYGGKFRKRDHIKERNPA